MLFDAGRGVTIRLNEIGIGMDKVTSLFLTHLHSDHIVGLPDLWLTGWMMGRYHTPLKIWGPPGTRKMMSKLEDAFAYDIHVRRDLDEKFPGIGVSVDVTEISQGTVYDHDGLKVTVFDVDHYPISPSFGYRIDYNGKSAVISGDTRFCENLIRYAQGTDLLIHEVGAAGDNLFNKSETVQNVMAHHTSPREAGEVFSRVKPELGVYTHMVLIGSTEKDSIEMTRETYTGPVIIGEDLMRFEIADKIEIQ